MFKTYQRKFGFVNFIRKIFFSGRRLGKDAAAVLGAIFITTLWGALEIHGSTTVPGPFALARFIHLHPATVWVSLTFASLCLLLAGRLITTVVLVGALNGIVAYASVTKLDYLGMPLTFGDLRLFLSDFEDNLVLFKSYPHLAIYVVLSLAMAAGVAVYLFRKERRRGVRSHMLAFTGLLCLVAYALAAKTNSINSPLLQQTMFDENQIILNGLPNMDSIKRKESGYVGDILEMFFNNYSLDFKLPPKIGSIPYEVPEKSESPAHKPDIFVVLEESTFDPRMLAGCKGIAACDSTLFNAQLENQRLGPMFVHASGGGTWLAEFTFLSGFDWRVFGMGGAGAPLNLAKRLQNSLPKHLKELGYQTFAVYPVAGNFLSAREAYKHYGFENFWAIEEMSINTGWHATEDRALLDWTLKEVNAKRDGRPVFVFLLTIRNHGPHAATSKDLPQDIESELKPMPSPLADYLHRMRESEKALNELSSKWLSSSTPRVLAWFGDHQPLFSIQSELNAGYIENNFGKSLSPDAARYLTWYSMSSNQKLTEKKDYESRVTDIGYLGAELLKFSGLPGRDSDGATFAIKKSCPWGIALCTDKEAVANYLSYRVWDLQEIQ